MRKYDSPKFFVGSGSPKQPEQTEPLTTDLNQFSFQRTEPPLDSENDFGDFVIQQTEEHDTDGRININLDNLSSGLTSSDSDDHGDFAEQYRQKQLKMLGEL